MPRYDFECEQCGTVSEHTFRMADKPETVACACGGSCRTLFCADIEVFVPGKPIPFTKPCAPPGWERGMTAERAERLYAQQVQATKKAARAQRRSLSRKKGGMRLKARIPEALLKARMNQFGKNYWIEEGTRALRRDDLVLD